MSVANANLLNALTLMGMSVWGFYSSLGHAKTALIPLVFGVVLLVLTNSIRDHNKTVAHIAVAVTLIALIALVAKPLPAAIDAGGLKLLRVGAMTLTGIISMIFFVRSFITARKAKR